MSKSGVAYSSSDAAYRLALRMQDEANIQVFNNAYHRYLSYPVVENYTCCAIAYNSMLSLWRLKKRKLFNTLGIRV